MLHAQFNQAVDSGHRVWVDGSRVWGSDFWERKLQQLEKTRGRVYGFLGLGSRDWETQQLKEASVVVHGW